MVFLEAGENQGSPGVMLGNVGQVSWDLGWADNMVRGVVGALEF